MSKPNLVLIKTIDTPHDELSEEFQKFKDSFPPDHQLSFFDIIVDGDNWFRDALEELNKE